MIGINTHKIIHSSNLVSSLLCIVFLFVTATLYPQTNTELFEQANELYRSDKYSEAIAFYEKIEAQGKVSSELYFNLGNSYYKINKVAPSIYNYEKALQLNPLNADAVANLVFAKRMSIDTIEELPKTVLQKIEDNYIQQLSYNQWAIISVAFSILMATFFLFFYFSHTPGRKRVYFVTSILSMLLLVVALVFSVKGYATSKNTIEAIIFTEKVTVKNAPTDNSEAIFELHEGTKVFVLDGVDIWKKIKLADGKTGWVSKGSLKEL